MTASCGLCEQGLEDGYLCGGCTKATVVRIEALPVLHRGLAPLLAPAGGSAQGRRSKGGPAPLPVNEAILDLRGPGGIVGVVEGWLAAICQERGSGERVVEGGIESRLQSAVKGLIGHMPWVAVSWPVAGEFAGEIRELVRSITSIISPSSSAAHGTRIGYCPAVFEDGVICGAVLRLAPGEQVVTCRYCETSYPPATWTGLKALIDEDEKGTQTVGTPGADQEEESWPSAS